MHTVYKCYSLCCILFIYNRWELTDWSYMLVFPDMNTRVTFIGENQMEVVYQVTYSTMAIQLAQLVEHWLLTVMSKVQSQVVGKSNRVIFPGLSL